MCLLNRGHLNLLNFSTAPPSVPSTPLLSTLPPSHTPPPHFHLVLLLHSHPQLIFFFLTHSSFSPCPSFPPHLLQLAPSFLLPPSPPPQAWACGLGTATKGSTRRCSCSTLRTKTCTPRTPTARATSTPTTPPGPRSSSKCTRTPIRATTRPSTSRSSATARTSPTATPPTPRSPPASSSSSTQSGTGRPRCTAALRRTSTGRASARSTSRRSRPSRRRASSWTARAGTPPTRRRWAPAGWSTSPRTRAFPSSTSRTRAR